MRKDNARLSSSVASLCTGLLIAISVPAGSARAELLRFGPFAADTELPHILRLSGGIEEAGTDHLADAILALPDLTVVALNSDGGLREEGLGMARLIRQNGLATVVLAGDVCASACATVFFGGTRRLAIGPLAVHRWSEPAFGQPLSEAEWRDEMAEFGVHRAVMDVTIATPIDDVHVFSREEIEEWQIDRERQYVLDQLAASGPDVPADGVDAALLSDLASGTRGNEAAFRAILERNNGAIPDRSWASFSTLAATALGHPAFVDRWAAAITAEGLTVENAIGTDAALSIAVDLILAATFRGIRRLSAADQATYVGLGRANAAWLRRYHPEFCATEAGIAEVAALAPRFVEQLDDTEFEALTALRLRGLEAELDRTAPLVMVGAERKAAVAAFNDALADADDIAADLFPAALDDPCYIAERRYTLLAALDPVHQRAANLNFVSVAAPPSRIGSIMRDAAPYLPVDPAGSQ